ncbi:MAG: transposase [Shimia sp.]|nr:transposase [Shimia sp.]
MNRKRETQLEQFREQLYQSFERCADSLMDLLDALSSQTTARSVVELSLEACFQREYSSLYKAIAGFFEVSAEGPAEGERREQEEGLLGIVANYVPSPAARPYWLFGTDVTSVPRQFARTLAERGYVYQPNPIKSNKPVTIGHQYAVMAHLPEKATREEPPWIVPLVVRRVSSQEQEATVGADLLELLMSDETLPWHDALSVHVGDTRYSTPDYLAAAAKHKNLVTMARLRSNRTLYRQPLPVEGKRKPGRPRWYGERFSLLEPETWPAPDEQVAFPYTSRRGRSYIIQIEGWHDMLMRGKHDCPMHKYPFTLGRIRWLDAAGQPVFKRPIWVVVSGQRRRELSLRHSQAAYAQRYDLEHFFRFGKQRLLLTSYQTPDLEHEENWWQLVQLAYVQLWLARPLADRLPRPWERYLPAPQTATPSPSAVQRDFGRIIRQLGTLAAMPKPRGNSPGRVAGTRLRPRVRSPVVKKSS